MTQRERDIPVHLMGFTPATLAVLERHKFSSLGELAAKTDKELLALNHIGEKRLREIRERVAALQV